MTSLADRARWRAALRRLRRIAPVKNVRVVYGPLRDYDGIATMCTLGHRVAISDVLGLSAAIETLIHEWVHVLLFEEEHPHPEQHGDAFWVRYGELYRAWHRCA